MNKTQKILIITGAIATAGFIALSSFAGNANVFIGVTSSTSNNTTSLSYPTNTFTTNINGVANEYLGWPTNTMTNSVQLLPARDQYSFVRVQNNSALVITVDPINPVIGSNGFVISAGGSLTFPTVSGGAIPSVLFAAPTNGTASAVATNIYTEGWSSKTGSN